VQETRRRFAAIAIALLNGCSHDWDAHERLPTSSATSGGGGGAGASASTSTAASGATGGGAGGSASCGDGSLDMGEQCDDGNDAAGDGCDACVVECDRAGAVQDAATHHCYWLVGMHENFDSARSHCQDAGPGVDLAAPSTASELMLLTPLLDADAWIGGSDSAMRGSWAWSNGEAWSYPPGAPPWHSGEPNNSGDCVNARTDGTLEDESCGTGKDYLCERTPAGE